MGGVMPADDTITIVVSLHDAGCLPGLLRRAVDDTERHARVCGHKYTPDIARDVEVYLLQLRGCLAAVDVARAQTSDSATPGDGNA